MKTGFKTLCAVVMIGVPSLLANYSVEQLEHWAFEPLLEVNVPLKEGENPIDVLLGAARKERGITSNSVANRVTLVRRAYMDLLGLPPTPEQTQAFVKNPSPHAYIQLVDELLENKHYGERWGRHWLDVARYGDSNGYRYDDDQPAAYHYRDFVIRAFNADMPYDQFVQWQIAGNEIAPDNLDAVTANGFLAVGPLERPEGSPDGRKLVRYNELDDLIGTTSSAMLGLTMSCARCHDHKFDPLTTKEYYQMAYVFNSGRRKVLDVERPLDEHQQEPFQEWLAANKAIDKDEAAWYAGQGLMVRQTFDEAKVKVEELEALALKNLQVQQPKATKKDFRKLEINDYVKKHKILTDKQLAELERNLRFRRHLDPEGPKYNPLILKDQLSPEGVTAYKAIRKRREKSIQMGFDQQNKVITYTDKSSDPVPTHVLERGLVTQEGEKVDLNFIEVRLSASGSTR